MYRPDGLILFVAPVSWTFLAGSAIFRPFDLATFPLSDTSLKEPNYNLLQLFSSAFCRKF